MLCFLLHRGVNSTFSPRRLFVVIYIPLVTRRWSEEFQIHYIQWNITEECGWPFRAGPWTNEGVIIRFYPQRCTHQGTSQKGSVGAATPITMRNVTVTPPSPTCQLHSSNSGCSVPKTALSAMCKDTAKVPGLVNLKLVAQLGCTFQEDTASAPLPHLLPPSASTLGMEGPRNAALQDQDSRGPQSPT